MVETLSPLHSRNTLCLFVQQQQQQGHQTFVKEISTRRQTEDTDELNLRVELEGSACGGGRWRLEVEQERSDFDGAFYRGALSAFDLKSIRFKVVKFLTLAMFEAVIAPSFRKKSAKCCRK